VIISHCFSPILRLSKVMLSAVVTGMIGVPSFQKVLDGWRWHPKTGSIGSSVIGGLIFGVGLLFLVIVREPSPGAVGQGSLTVFWRNGWHSRWCRILRRSLSKVGSRHPEKAILERDTYPHEVVSKEMNPWVHHTAGCNIGIYLIAFLDGERRGYDCIQNANSLIRSITHT